MACIKMNQCHILTSSFSALWRSRHSSVTWLKSTLFIGTLTSPMASCLEKRSKSYTVITRVFPPSSVYGTWWNSRGNIRTPIIPIHRPDGASVPTFLQRSPDRGWKYEVEETELHWHHHFTSDLQTSGRFLNSFGSSSFSKWPLKMNLIDYVY